MTNSNIFIEKYSGTEKINDIDHSCPTLQKTKLSIDLLMMLEYITLNRMKYYDYSKKKYHKCSICGKLIEVKKYSYAFNDKEYVYHEDLLHYFHVHNVHPSDEFKNVLEKIFLHYYDSSNHLYQTLYNLINSSSGWYPIEKKLIGIMNDSNYTSEERIHKYFDMKYFGESRHIFEFDLLINNEMTERINIIVDKKKDLHRDIKYRIEILCNKIVNSSRYNKYDFLDKYMTIFGNSIKTDVETIMKEVINEIKTKCESNISKCHDLENTQRNEIINEYMECLCDIGCDRHYKQTALRVPFNLFEQTGYHSYDEIGKWHKDNLRYEVKQLYRKCYYDKPIQPIQPAPEPTVGGTTIINGYCYSIPASDTIKDYVYVPDDIRRQIANEHHNVIYKESIHNRDEDIKLFMNGDLFFDYNHSKKKLCQTKKLNIKL